MELESLLQGAAKPQEQPKLNKWDRMERQSFYLALCAGSCSAVFLARIFPPILPFVGLSFLAGAAGLIAWALLTPGNQNLEIAFTCIAGVLGVCIGLKDAVTLLTLLDARWFIGAGLVGLCLIVAGIMEVKSNATRR